MSKRLTGAERIAQERQRQIEEEGYQPKHDDQYKHKELIAFAMAYACWDFNPGFSNDVCPPDWVFKPSGDPIRNLEKAGALIAAEIDRLQRAREDNDA